MSGSVWISSYPSPFGNFSIIWQQSDNRPKVRRILLPDKAVSSERSATGIYPKLYERSHPRIDELGQKIGDVIAGRKVAFRLDAVALENCSPFQCRVLVAEFAMPRGRLTTYGRLARYLGNRRAARAIGRALATNPFPILIPCHRTIRADGYIGGYQGGSQLKRTLLIQEGFQISNGGKVLNPHFFTHDQSDLR
jgi:methylated-DNA-[protein]-cysteine S-methyltransferase